MQWRKTGVGANMAPCWPLHSKHLVAAWLLPFRRICRCRGHVVRPARKGQHCHPYMWCQGPVILATDRVLTPARWLREEEITKSWQVKDWISRKYAHDLEYCSASRQKEKETTAKEAPGKVSPLRGYSHGDGTGSLPGDELAITAARISIHRIIDIYSHHLSCHFERQLNNSQFYFPTLDFRTSVNLKDVSHHFVLHSALSNLDFGLETLAVIAFTSITILSW